MLNPSITGPASILKYYIKTLFQSANLNWSSDNDTEIDFIVEGIYSAAYQHALKDARNESKGLAKEYS